MTINSTPQNPSSHAAKLRSKAFGCIELDEKDMGSSDDAEI
ncbi:hypothetical protein [Agrobacterium larrymoorei]|uniref:Uncharacterized protein n=1 Tax=Agrobacterium larrymoorei TaxID=160699 RepID=A0AAF0KFH7_9HYPH|nr:hypothetical protein [Agrobacterium larrymoorei]WHA42192.1 hypothetical protein CFBP5477_006095 [Agrobacterium larrymoorei]